MMFLLTCLCLLVPLISARSAPSKMFIVDPMPAPDGNLNIYKLPSGQGGAHIIQCPDGDLSVYDLGANDEGDPRFMQGEQFQQFLGTQNDRVQNVILSHHHLDHYSMLANTFPTAASIPGLQNIFISCTLDTAAADVVTWVNQIGAGSLVRTFNNGGRCGPHPTGYTACSDIPLCPNTPAVRGQVLAANMGQHCTDGGNKNVDSIYLKVSYGTFSTHLQGDFEDETTSLSENGPYQYLIDYYGAGMLTTVYTFSHHGASSQSNKPNIRAATQPKALWSDGNPWYSYNHPRCLLFDEFANTTQSVCKPAVTDTSSPFYCGVHIDPNVPVSAKLQSTYTCGFSTSATVERETRYNNEWAFYTTIPDEFTINIIKLSTDGDLWGFTTNVFATP